MNIYPARHGQNWQMLLPVYYTSRHGFINEPLYKYRVEDSSMSSQVLKMPFRQFKKRQDEYVEIVRLTLLQIPALPQKELRDYLGKFKKRVHIQNLDVAMMQGSLVDRFFWKCVVKIDRLFL